MSAKVALVERGEILWEPDRDDTAAHRFARAHGFDDYAALHAWSIDDLEGFWGAIGERVRWRTPPTAVLRGGSMPGARWFPGGTLSYAEHATGAIVARSQTRGPMFLVHNTAGFTLGAGDGRRRPIGGIFQEEGAMKRSGSAVWQGALAGNGRALPR